VNVFIGLVDWFSLLIGFNIFYAFVSCLMLKDMYSCFISAIIDIKVEISLRNYYNFDKYSC
jgi:hypothetical protein